MGTSVLDAQPTHSSERNEQIIFVRALVRVCLNYKDERPYNEYFHEEIRGLFSLIDFDNVQAVLRGPGLIFVLPFLEKIRKVDTRTQAGATTQQDFLSNFLLGLQVFEVPPQQILSTDSVTVSYDIIVSLARHFQFFFTLAHCRRRHLLQCI